MTEPFILSIHYKGETMDLPAQLLLTGFTHRFKITVHGADLLFEPDEEGLYRAVAPPENGQHPTPVADRQLLQLIQEKIAAILL